MEAQCWACSGNAIGVNILDRIKSFDEFFLVEPLPYFLYMSNSYRDHFLVTLGVITAFQLFFEVVFNVVFISLEVVSV